MRGPKSPNSGHEDNLRTADLAWGLGLLLVIGLLVARNFFLGRPTLGNLHLGPVELSSFGLLAVLDLLFGYYLIRRWCRRFGLGWESLTVDLVWIVGIGYFVSHLVSVVFYTPEQATDLRVLLDYRRGISSFGGIYGGGLVALAVFARRGLARWRYLDPLVLGFVGGYVFGRAGCFAIHDHPGRETDLFLGVEIGGVRRHDLGFYEMWLMLALTLAILLLARRRRPPDGAVFALVATLYPPIRFALDFLRIGEPAYAGLSPGQWMALPLFGLGLWRLAVLLRGRDARAPPGRRAAR